MTEFTQAEKERRTMGKKEGCEKPRNLFFSKQMNTLGCVVVKKMKKMKKL